MEFSQILQVLPKHFQTAISLLPPGILEGIEEIRIRNKKPLYLVHAGKEKSLSQDGRLNTPRPIVVLPEDIATVLEKASDSSLYSVIENLKDGFITIDGGHRIGVCGTVVMREGQIASMKHISSMSIRVAREKHGISIPSEAAFFRDGAVRNALIVSSPGIGKTTLLRDIIRNLSMRGIRVGIADEKGEISGITGGVEGFSLGDKVDILSRVKKAKGMLMLIKNMSPSVIAVDEITEEEDIFAMEQAANCGVSVLATAHASSFEELSERPLYRKLLAENIFSSVILIALSGTERVFSIVDL